MAQLEPHGRLEALERQCRISWAGNKERNRKLGKKIGERGREKKVEKWCRMRHCAHNDASNIQRWPREIFTNFILWRTNLLETKGRPPFVPSHYTMSPFAGRADAGRCRRPDKGGARFWQCPQAVLLLFIFLLFFILFPSPFARLGAQPGRRKVLWLLLDRWTVSLR